jgi:PAS domain S-box-containing protein
MLSTPETAARFKMRFRFTALLVVVFSLTAVGALLWTQFASQEELRRQLVEQSEKRAIQVADVMADQIAATIDRVDFLLVQAREAYTGDAAHFRTAVDLLARSFPKDAVLQISVAAADGTLTWSNLPMAGPVNIRDRDHFRAHLDGKDRLYISKPVLGRVSKAWSVQFSRPILRAHRFAGVIVLSMRPEYLAKLLASAESFPGDVMTLVHQDGEFIARSRDLEKVLGRKAPADRSYFDAGGPAYGVFRAPSAVDPSDKIFGWRRIPETELIVSAGLDTAATLGPADREIAEDVTRTAAIALLIVVLGSAIALLLLQFARQQDRLELSEGRMAALLDGIPDRAWLKDAQGRFLAVNRSEEVARGIPAAQFIGKTASDLYSAEEGRQVNDEDRKAMAASGPSRFERIAMLDGTWREYVKAPIRTAQGKVVGLVGLSRDITERKRAEEALREASARIEAMNDELEERVRRRTVELEALVQEMETFNYAVAHDLNTSLGVMSVNAGMLLHDLGGRLSADDRRALGAVSENAQLAAKLLEDLMEHSRLGRDAIERKPVAMRDLAMDAWRQLVRAEADRQVSFEAGDLPRCTGDRGMLARLWASLLSNALKYTKTRAQALVEVGYDPKQNAYYVRDNGVGFDMQYAHKLFNVFERLHREAHLGGTGIGLAIAARIVQRHGGRIWAEARPGEGATFFFTLSA